ncbi:hypothetical protein [Saccharothrix obliqua]|uniref:hypothetical protein n=1 Tax=Saccharothrix obliqua TaxID=2861747 RepID=UPI001C606C9A|nr:hypothetical protein [Saccharothrix obliqua]MBW4722109.1 hypothetical protein [Saccharothrix obliqua]
MGIQVSGRAVVGGVVTLGSAILLSLAVAAPALAATTDVNTARNYAGARYDSSIDTFTVWDNGPNYRSDDGTSARLKVTKKNTSLTFTKTHEWRAGVNGQSRNFVLPNTFGSGDEISIQICSLNSSGGTLECRTGTAWV